MGLMNWASKEVSVYLPILNKSSRSSNVGATRPDGSRMDQMQRLAVDFLRPLPPEDEMGDELFKDLRAEAAHT